MTEATAFLVGWSQKTIRFNEEDQLVDLTDCFDTLYSTQETSRVQIHKYFTMELAKTEKIVDVEKNKWLHTVRWDNARQGRKCLKATVAKTFFEKRLGHLPNAKRLANMLDKERITIEIMTTASSTGEIEIDTSNRSKTNTPVGEITREEALLKANSTLVLHSYNTKVIAEQAEDSLRVKRARDEIELVDIEKQEKMNSACLRLQTQQIKEFADRRVYQVKEQANTRATHEDEKRMDTRRKMQVLLDKIEVAQTAENMARVVELRAKLDTMLAASD